MTRIVDVLPAPLVRLADELEGTSTIIGLLRWPHAFAWSARTALALAEEIGRRRGRTLLCSLEASPSELDGILGGARGEGLGAVLRGEARVSDTAVSGEGQAFSFLPAGRDADPAERTLASPGLRALVTRVRTGGGTALLYVPVEDLGPGPPADLLDGWILIGPHGPLPGGVEPVPVLGQIPRPAEPRLAKRARGRRRRSSARFARAVRGVGATGTVALLVWLGWRLLGGGSDATLPRAVATGAPEASAGSPADTTDLENVRSLPGAVASAAVPYSVLIDSYVDWDDALDRTRRLEASGGSVYFVAPTPVGGKLYYRVFAGAQEDGKGAVDLMEELVSTGRKEESSAWDMRPVRLAYSLGSQSSPGDAAAERDRLRSAGVPAYVLPIRVDGARRYHLYSGAYETAAAAEPLGLLLARAGVDATLVTRRGEKQ
ncbi:MAG: SPOR domain-containing protein [Gemmatimonadota bacterium]